MQNNVYYPIFNKQKNRSPELKEIWDRAAEQRIHKCTHCGATKKYIDMYFSATYKEERLDFCTVSCIREWKKTGLLELRKKYPNWKPVL